MRQVGCARMPFRAFAWLLLGLSPAQPVIGAVILTQTPARTSTPDLNLTGDSFAAGRGILYEAGYTILATPVIDAHSLSLADVFYLSLLPPDSMALELGAQEVDALVQFVNSGGGLVIQGDGPLHRSQTNALASAFGVTYTAGASSDPVTVLDFSTSITNGPAGVVDVFTIRSGGALEGNMLSIATGAGGDVVLAALLPANEREGRVVFLSSVTAFVTARGLPITAPGNAALWENVFAFAVPEPGSLVGLLAAAPFVLRAGGQAGRRRLFGRFP